MANKHRTKRKKRCIF